VTRLICRVFALLGAFLTLAFVLTAGAAAQNSQQSPWFTPGNLVVVVEGCGAHGGTCTSVANGTGTGAGNSSAGGYGDNQAAPLTLFQYIPNGTSGVTFVNSLAFPQAASFANFPVSSEYGSSSEGTLQLSGAGQYLTVMGYGLAASTFDAAYPPGFTADLFGAAPSGAMAQSGSLTGQTAYTPVARVVALVDPYGNVNSSTAVYNVFNTNNPRSIYTADGVNAYISGQGSGCDLTGGVFYVPLGTTTTQPTAITGGDADPTSSCIASGFTGSLIAQDTRTVQIYDNTLYISIDSTEGKSNNRSLIGTLGTPPATSLFAPTDAPTGDTGGPNLLSGLGNTGGTGKETITSANGNGLNAGLQINLSPLNYFFASPSVLYVTDGGSPKQTSANSTLGDGGLQKWTNSKSNGSGTWMLAYTMASGLNLVANTSASGTTGLYGLAGAVSGNNVYLYTTNFTVADLDPTYLYGITDPINASTNPGTPFTLLEAAPADSNFKGVSFAPTLPDGSATITTSPSGLAVTTAGEGCAAGTYTTPVTLLWTPGSSCTLSAVSPQGAAGAPLVLKQWQDGTTGTSDTVTAPSTSAIYSATFRPVDSAISLQFSSTQLTYPGATNVTACVARATKTTPTGSIQIEDGTTVLTTLALQGNGCAYWYISPGLSAGSHTISGVYSGDKNNPSGQSAPTVITVNPVPVNLSASCWNASYPFGGNYQCTVNISSNAGSALGDTTYSYDGGAAVSIPLNNGNAQFTITEPVVGNQNVVIGYARQGNFAAAASVTENFTVTPAPVNVLLTPSTYYTAVGNTVTFKATVSSWSAGAPNSNGEVSFYDGATLLATVPVNGSGSASYTTTSLAVGTQTVTATYAGGANYASGSSSATITIAK
jgi:Bacterial Ig-like domain (group 3)